MPASTALQDPMLSALLNFVVDICVQSIIDPNSKNLNGLTLVFSVRILLDHFTYSFLLIHFYRLSHLVHMNNN